MVAEAIFPYICKEKQAVGTQKIVSWAKHPFLQSPSRVRHSATGLLTLSHHHLPRPISLELTVAFKEENQVIR